MINIQNPVCYIMVKAHTHKPVIDSKLDQHMTTNICTSKYGTNISILRKLLFILIIDNISISLKTQACICIRKDITTMLVSITNKMDQDYNPYSMLNLTLSHSYMPIWDESTNFTFFNCTSKLSYGL